MRIRRTQLPLSPKASLPVSFILQNSPQSPAAKSKGTEMRPLNSHLQERVPMGGEAGGMNAGCFVSEQPFGKITLSEMKLWQNQVWKQGDKYLRIVELERLEVQYKDVENLLTRVGVHHRVSKKEFCRLIKGATLLTQEEVREIWTQSPTSFDELE